MSIPLWITFRERTHGVNSSGFADVFNRPNRTIWSNFTVQHNKDGTHKDDLVSTSIWVMEADSYTGDGTDNRTISLSNGDLDAKFVRIMSADYAYSWFATATMLPDAINTSGYSGTNRIQAMGVGSFQVGSDDEVNKNGSTFHYIVYGSIYTVGGS